MTSCNTPLWRAGASQTKHTQSPSRTRKSPSQIWEAISILGTVQRPPHFVQFSPRFLGCKQGIRAFDYRGSIHVVDPPQVGLRPHGT